VHEILAPNAGGDDYPRIQAAIDAVAARPADSRGLRGVVLLRRGRYTLSRTLVIRSGGVVLRGEGRGNDGSVIRSAIRERLGTIIDVGNYEQRMPRADRDARRTPIAMDSVPVGAMRIEVESAKGYRVGDTVAIAREANARWLGPRASIPRATAGPLASTRCTTSGLSAR
jgi:pectin methylesterase-like acyl-CoA thioesterase